MSRTLHPMRTVAAALAALGAAGPALAHPGHLNTSLFTDFAHYLQHLIGDAGPLLAALPLALAIGWALRARSRGSRDVSGEADRRERRR